MPESDNQLRRAFYSREYHAEPRGRMTRHYQKLVHRFSPGGKQRWLDVACGQGELLEAVVSRGYMAAGTDIAMPALQIAQQHLPSTLLCESGAEQLPFADDSFDVVSCLGALEHFYDQPAALNEMHRVLKGSGALLLVVPNAGFLTRRLGLFSGTEQVAVRETVYSLEEWQRLFEQSGFSLQSRWRDLHVLSRDWIMRKGVLRSLARAMQALLLTVWPLRWQYQVYFLLTKASDV